MRTVHEVLKGTHYSWPLILLGLIGFSFPSTFNLKGSKYGVHLDVIHLVSRFFFLTFVLGDFNFEVSGTT